MFATTKGVPMKDAGGQGLAPPLHPWPGLHFLTGVFGNQGQHVAYPHAWERGSMNSCSWASPSDLAR